MKNLKLFHCSAHYDHDGNLVIQTEICPLTPMCIDELDLRQKINYGLAQAYLEHFKKYMSTPEGQEELDFLKRLLKYRPSFEDQPNPKSTENNHEII
jgi:hypothetical protein